MKCDEVQQLHGPYLDSELDAKTTLEVQQHVATCPECARVLTAQAKADTRIMAGLKLGQRTPALWEQVEQRVIATARSNARPRCTTSGSQPISWWRELLWPSPWAWAGGAAAWAMIFLVNYSVSVSSEGASLARSPAPPPAAIEMALAQRRILMASLFDPQSSAKANAPRKTLPPRPRSELKTDWLHA